MRHHFPINTCWNGASSWPWVSVTVQCLCVGTQKLRQDTSKLMAFHFMGFIIFFASAKQPLQLEREWKRCETQILMRHTLSVHPLVPVTRFEPPHVNAQPSTGPGSDSEAVHKEVPQIRRDLRFPQHLCQGAFSHRDNKPAWALLWCSKGLDSGTCWALAASLSSLRNVGFS